MSDWVQWHMHERVATVTLNRADLHNAFNDQMITELHRAFETLDQDPDVRVIILKGEGKSFCAGADLNWMKRMIDYSFEENQQDARALSQMLFAIRNCSKPVIARVHGAAFGGGVGLVAACDMAVAMDSVKFSLSEVKLGIVPAVISPFVYEKMGSWSRRYALTAERFTAQEALKAGLVHHVVADEAVLDTQVQLWVKALLENGPEAVSTCKALFRAMADFRDDHTREAYTTECIALRRISEEGQEGMRAFLEKRPPRWIQEAPLTHG